MRSQMSLARLILAVCSTLANMAAGAAEPTASASKILTDHDRAVMRDLDAYLLSHPKADDRDEAYSAIFDKAIAHDWFAETEPVARRYLAESPAGGVKALARIVGTMARARAGKFAEALASYRELMTGLGGVEQEEFAANFADQLAGEAITAGEFAVARSAYEILLAKFDRPELAKKVADDLTRLDRVGKVAPVLVANDIDGQPIRLSDYKGKYVLVDFWATWCAPCLAELPNLTAAYEAYHKKGFEIISVSLDEKPDAVVDFVKAREIPWPQVHDGSAGGDPVAAFGVANIPASYLIGPDGSIVRLDLRGPALERTLSGLFKGGK